MLRALAFLIGLIILSDTLVVASGLPVPGPALGLGILVAGFAWRGGAHPALERLFDLAALLFPLLDVLATLAPKSATVAVVVEIARSHGGAVGIKAVVVILTGIFGAVAGPAIPMASGVRDPRAVGFALSLASHAIGIARAFQLSEVAGCFASLGMIPNGILTIALVPLFLSLLAA